MALAYQDKRDDAGHAEITVFYAGMLFDLEGGDEDFVIPAMILYDVGWSQLKREEWIVVFDTQGKPRR